MAAGKKRGARSLNFDFLSSSSIEAWSWNAKKLPWLQCYFSTHLFDINQGQKCMHDSRHRWNRGEDEWHRILTKMLPRAKKLKTLMTGSRDFTRKPGNENKDNLATGELRRDKVAFGAASRRETRPSVEAGPDMTWVSDNGKTQNRQEH